MKMEIIQNYKKINPLQKKSIVDLRGRRQTIETFQEKTNKFGNIADEIIDDVYYINKSYLEYEAWSKVVSKECFIENLKIDEM